ncbi:Putative protein [Zobellia galactanivorans]|uniref:Uncharacterized protein n=1 Tax=Zobellia galactanivorans (strain DSM 12802 / CCUG 47099 / CIP 106680 / NCIMB 13871 / Dsij) TaxID=63186 RepID=G0L5S8_ZOBGA|nr:Putative protein [Zobellia galactanivorans]
MFLFQFPVSDSAVLKSIGIDKKESSKHIKPTVTIGLSITKPSCRQQPVRTPIANESIRSTKWVVTVETPYNFTLFHY